MTKTADGPRRPPEVGGALRETETATRRRMIDAAVASILEQGFYRASTNEIARRAGVTWGVIQHHFATREGLMLAVLQDGARQYAESVEGMHVDAASVQGRIEQLIDILCAHYGRPQYLAYLQILLNMDHDPKTSADVRRTMLDLAERSHEHVRRLLRETLGTAASTPDLATTVFLVVRGFGISQQLQDSMAYDQLAPKGDRLIRQRRLLAAVLAPYLGGAGAPT